MVRRSIARSLRRCSQSDVHGAELKLTDDPLLPSAIAAANLDPERHAYAARKRGARGRRRRWIEAFHNRVLKPTIVREPALKICGGAEDHVRRLLIARGFLQGFAL